MLGAIYYSTKLRTVTDLHNLKTLSILSAAAVSLQVIVAIMSYNTRRRNIVLLLYFYMIAKLLYTLTTLFEFGLYELYLCFFAPNSDKVCTLKTLGPKMFLIFIWFLLCTYFTKVIYRFIKLIKMVKKLEDEYNSVEGIVLEVEGINSTGLKLNEEESETLNQSISQAPLSISIEKCDDFDPTKIPLVREILSYFDYIRRCIINKLKLKQLT